MITFNRLNLMNEWPIKGPFDFMFCRNVVIYFDKPTQRVLFDRYANLLVDDALLFLGHSETMFKVCDRFKLIGNTIYQKIK
jgi:chemotaxis protein methyltransferase CheR